MNDVLEQSPKRGGPDEKKRRRAYIATRLKEIGADIRDMTAEREKVAAELAAEEPGKRPASKKLRDRRAYLAARLTALRQEQKSLGAERTSLAPAGSEKKAASGTTGEPELDSAAPPA
jgi:predicted  nucleic acid-binding Zn-ribbon protein